ncbi:MAG: hypothetical protein QXP59_04000 [Saccharolobus sp.]
MNKSNMMSVVNQIKTEKLKEYKEVKRKLASYIKKSILSGKTKILLGEKELENNGISSETINSLIPSEHDDQGNNKKLEAFTDYIKTGPLDIFTVEDWDDTNSSKFLLKLNNKYYYLFLKFNSLLISSPYFIKVKPITKEEAVTIIKYAVKI